MKEKNISKFEFMGPHGTILAIIGLPCVVVGLYLFCNEESCPTFNPRQHVYWNWMAFFIYVAWILLHFMLAAVLPGRWAKGVQLVTGEQLNYKLNGLNAFYASVSLILVLVYIYGVYPLLWLSEFYFELAIAGIVFASLASVFLYLFSFRSNKLITANGGNTGYPIYDFWMGRELNPRIFGLDLKYVCELRPGLIGWVILNAAFSTRQYVALGYLTNSMLAVNIFQLYYVLDALINEKAILTTMDITTDGFGYMLCFGDLVWVPFTYTLQARYLEMYPQNLSVPFFCGIVALNIIGLWIFRSSNSEKNAFRTNPSQQSVKHLKYITTKSGSKLLISGWWGSARKINYFGTYF